MVQIKPYIHQNSQCPHCQGDLEPLSILWQGMHICIETECTQCHAKIIDDLKVGHATVLNNQIDLEKNQYFGSEWLSQALLNSLKNPIEDKINITKEIFKSSERVIILNCIDFLYGHCLLKLLNAQSHIDNDSDYGLIVIVPKFMRWLVPDGVSEIWTVDIKLGNSQKHYSSFHQFVSQEMERFQEVYVSKAYSHPQEFNISRFTRIPKHDFQKEDVIVSFIWREDRLWINSLIARGLKKTGLKSLAYWFQNWKIRNLFQRISLMIPEAKFVVTGLGKNTIFPSWIRDERVEKFDDKSEIKICQIYSDSRLVIGIHGSNMLLPSGHAGMTIDIMPKDRWGNFAQDILYAEQDERIAGFRYRYLPDGISLKQLVDIIKSMIIDYSEFISLMTAAKKGIKN
ncbi:hypothetical protein IJ00_07330 [Calothrix sp. 336/3]|nr:hypothetical protein IJ00_07330 [Calothrix sp. 336/3]